MAKKVILKDLDNVEILPITRGELIVDSSGKEAFHSNEFLATNSLPGLMSPEEKAKLSTMAGNTIDSTLSTTSVNPVQNKVVTVAINEAKQLANDALETANDASENVSRVQQIINSIKESYLKSATVNGNVLTIVDLSDSEITFTNTTYNTFLKETAANTGGRNGLVPKPNYNDGSKTRFLREDGTWVIPTDTKNTAGSTNSTSKLFLIGATSQAANPQTYSNSSVYTTNGTLYATTFVGNLDGTYVNKLTGYKIAEAIGSISVTDSLNTALGKLEFKTDFIYNDLFGTDNDNVINKWHEIVDFVDSVAEGTDIIDEFVTRKTAQTITGEKIFSGTSASLLTIDRNSTNPAWVKFAKNNNLLGYIGIDNDKKPVVNIDGTLYYILHSGNSFIKNGVITINGTSITPLTAHQSLANYVTLNTNQTITGVKTFSTQLKFTVADGTSPFTVTSKTLVTNLNADLLDGTHKSGLLTALANINDTNNPLSIYITVGGTTKYLKVSYSQHSSDLVNTSVTNPDSAVSGQYLKWYSQINRSGSDPYYAGTNTGFPVGNNANGILWLGTHSGPYGGLLGVSSNGRLYYRFITNNTFPTTANGGSWKTLAWTSDIPTVTNYYWANVKISSTSSTTTKPTFALATVTTSVETPLILNTSGILTLNGKTNIYLKINNTDSLAINLAATYLKPFGSAKNLIDLGTSDARWKCVYSNTGNFTSNVESITTTSDAVKHAVTNANGSVELLIHSNRGLYDRTNAKWIIYVPNGTSNVYVPTWASRGSSTLPIYFNASGEPIACTSYANYIKWTSTDASLGVIGKLTLGSTTNTLYDLFITSNGTVIADSTDLNTIKTPGIRYSASSTNSATMTNTPWTSSGFRLITLTGYSSSSSYGILLALSSQLFFWRTMGSSNASPSSWYSWILFKYGTAVGNSTTPIYINSSGTPTACTAYSGLLTALSSTSTTNISITVGGTTKTITDMWATNLANKYSSRPTTIAPGVTGDGGMFQFKCTSSVTDTATDPGDGHILHFNWDSTGGYDAQLFLPTSSSALKVRGMSGGTWQSWATVLTNLNYTSYLGYIGTTAVQSSSAVQTLTGISRITNSTSSALYLGNSGNLSWVYTQDIASHSGTSYWAINVSGTGWFKVLNVGYTYNTSGSYAFNVTGTAGVSKLIVTTANLYRDAGGIILNNSDIWGLNAIYTLDLADAATEGYLFKRTNGNYDSLWCKDGVFYFSPNGNSTDGYGNNYTVYHSGNLTKSTIGLGNVQNTAFYKRSTSVNGTAWDMAGTVNSAAFTIFAPTTAGTSGYVLKSNGSGAPTWIALSSITAGNSDKLDNLDSTAFFRQLGTNLDINTFADGSNKNGIIYINTTTPSDINAPFSYGSILSMNLSAASWMIACSSAGVLSYRNRWWSGNGNAWGSWKTILDSSNSSVSGGGSALGSSITVKINGTSATLTIPSHVTTASLVIGSNSSSSPGNALLVSGAGRADTSPGGDTWLYYDSLGGTSTPWGIKHEQASNLISFYGSGTRRVYIDLSNGNISCSTINGYTPITSGNIGSQSVNYANSAGNADTVDGYHASSLWRSDGATWNPSANITMTPTSNGQEWSFDFRSKGSYTGSYWHVWDESKSTLLKVDADSGAVSAPYGFVGNLSGSASWASYLPTLYNGGQQTNPLTYFNSGIGVRVAMTGMSSKGTSYWSDTLWVNGYSGSDVPNMCALHFNRDGAPRMFISAQSNRATAYGTFYEIVTGYNYTSILDGRYVNAAGDTMTGTLHMKSQTGSYSEGIRIYPYSSWSTLMLLGTDITAASGTSTGSWGLFNNAGTFYINKGNSSGANNSRAMATSTGWTFGNTSRNSYALNAASFICDSWVRTCGATGWYNESYGGGMYMEDSTYVRTYNGKAFYVSNSGQHAIYTAGGFASAKTNGSVFSTYYNGTWYGDALYTHGNGNLSISPPGGSLYLAYNRGNTYFGGGTYYINRSGYFNGTAAAANSVAWANVTGKPTIPTNTWRGVINNLTSTSTTDSLTANMGRVLANGLSDLPVVLLAGTLYRSSAGTNTTWYFTGIRHRAVSSTNPTISVSGGVARFYFTPTSGYGFSIYAVNVNHQASGEATGYTATEYSTRSSGLYWFGAYATGLYIYIRAISQGDQNNDTAISYAGQWDSYDDGVTRIQIIAVGYAW